MRAIISLSTTGWSKWSQLPYTNALGVINGDLVGNETLLTNAGNFMLYKNGRAWMPGMQTSSTANRVIFGQYYGTGTIKDFFRIGAGARPQFNIGGSTKEAAYLSDVRSEVRVREFHDYVGTEYIIRRIRDY